MKYHYYSQGDSVLFNLKVVIVAIVFCCVCGFVGIKFFDELYGPGKGLESPNILVANEEAEEKISNDVSEEIKVKVSDAKRNKESDTPSNGSLPKTETNTLNIKGIDEVDPNIVNVGKVYASYNPEKVLNYLNTNGWVFYISGTEITSRYKGDVKGSIAGFTNYDTNEVYIRGSESSIRYCFLHEVGHVVDKMLNFPSYKSEWKTIYNEEKDKLSVFSYDGHYKSTPQEYFAEVYSESLINPVRCKNTAPKSYAYVKEVLK